MKKILSTVILILLVIHVMATVYWVSPTGTDLATGRSRSAAWQTIAKVNTASFQEGDIIRFKRGYTFNDDTLVINQNNIDFIPWDVGKEPIIEYVYYDTLTYSGVGFTNMDITNLLYDITAPVMLAFVIPETSEILTISIDSLTATDEIGVTGYNVTETDTVGGTGWELPAPTTYVFSTGGTKILYAWAKDASGNVSTSLSDTIVVASQYPENYAGTIYYVSSDGSDAYPGTKEQPFQTVTKANTVLVADSTTVLFNSIDTFAGTITPAASGIATGNINVGAYGIASSTPVISGFTTVTGWISQGDTIYKKYISTTSTPDIVTINGVQYAMGRTPNSDRYNLAVTDYYHIDSINGTTKIIDSECNAAVTDWDGAEIVIRGSLKTDWIRGVISDHTDTTLTFTNAAGKTFAVDYGYFIQDHLQTLDQFGEWYFSSSDTLYMYFGAANPTSYTVKISTTDKLFDVNTRDYITVKNLKFEGANVAAITTNTSSSNATNLTIDSCDFDFNHTAIYGHTAPDMTVTNCNILRSSNRGIYNHWNSDGYYIANNVIDSTGLVLGSAEGSIDLKTMTGIYAGFAHQVTSANKGIIENNSISNSGFYGISFGGDSAISRNNLVDKYCLLLADGGGIHKTGPSFIAATDSITQDYRNMVISDNIILNAPSQTEAQGLPASTTNTQINGIYADVWTFDITISGNTMANSPQGAYILGVQDIVFSNNTIFNCDYGVKFHKRGNATDTTLFIRNLTGSGNKIINYAGDYPLVSFKDLHADSLLLFGTWNNNYYSSAITDLTPFEQSIVYVTTDLNQSQWNTATGEDSTSYLTYNKGDSIVFDYYTGDSTKTVSLGSTYMLADSTEITSYQLAPYESIVAFKDTVTIIEIDSIYAAYPLNANPNDSVAAQDGTVTGAVVTASGKFQEAYDFLTNTDNIYFPINTAALTAADSSYSVSFWVKLDNLASTLGYSVYLFSDIKTGVSYKVALQINTANTLVFQVRNSALDVKTVNSATGAMASTGVWYNIVLNIPSAGEIGQIFINGVRSTGGTQNTFVGASRTSDYRFYLSKYTGTSGFDGQIDDVIIRKCWTTEAEAAYIYNSGTGRYYPFDN